MTAIIDDVSATTFCEPTAVEGRTPARPIVGWKAVRVGGLADAEDLIEVLERLGCANAELVVLPRRGLVVRWV